MLPKLTKEQAIVLTGFTGKTCVRFDVFHEDVEKRLGYTVFTHQFANKAFADKVKELYREDFLSMIEEW